MLKELKIEKDEVARLRSIVTHLETENTDFRKRLTDVENEASKVFKDNEQIRINLEARDKEATSLGSEKVSLTEKVKGMVSQLSEVQTQNDALVKERESLLA
jgi:uncharacterized protein (DUF3084 family)